MALVLHAAARAELGKKVKRLRTSGHTPLVMYGHGTTPQSILAESKTLAHLWKEAGSSQLVDVTVDQGKPVKVLFHAVQIHPVSGDLLHADLYQVKMTEKIETEIPLKFVGESPAVRDLEGILVTEKDALEIRCLPADLVPEFAVDLSVLKTFDDAIKVSDVPVPAAIEVLNDPDEMVALVTEAGEEETFDEAPTGAETEAEAIKSLEEQAAAEKAAETVAEPEESAK